MEIRAIGPHRRAAGAMGRTTANNAGRLLSVISAKKATTRPLMCQQASRTCGGRSGARPMRRKSEHVTCSTWTNVRRGSRDVMRKMGSCLVFFFRRPVDNQPLWSRCQDKSERSKVVPYPLKTYDCNRVTIWRPGSSRRSTESQKDCLMTATSKCTGAINMIICFCCFRKKTPPPPFFFLIYQYLTLHSVSIQTVFPICKSLEEFEVCSTLGHE